MSTITLTSDFGLKDYHVASLKGSILSEINNTNIIDISHQISPFNLTETAYILRNSYHKFPKKTVHVIAVDSEYSDDNKLIVAKYNNQYFVCADNGVLTMIIDDVENAEIYAINITGNLWDNFNSTSTLISSACHILKGKKLSTIGRKISTIKKLSPLNPIISKDGRKITGNIIYIDNYGNAISNISRDFINNIKGEGNMVVTFRNHFWNKIFNQYNEIAYKGGIKMNDCDGKKLALFNSEDLLEIAIYRSNLDTVGGASTLLGIRYLDTLTVEIQNNTDTK